MDRVDIQNLMDLEGYGRVENRLKSMGKWDETAAWNEEDVEIFRVRIRGTIIEDYDRIHDIEAPDEETAIELAYEIADEVVDELHSVDLE